MEKLLWDYVTFVCAAFGFLLVGILTESRAPHLIFGLFVLGCFAASVLDLRITEHIFVLWSAYSIVFKILSVAEEESPIFIVWGTLLHAGLIVLQFYAAEWMHTKRSYNTLVALALVLPVHCNNMFYEPVWALGRTLVFLVIVISTEKRSWLVSCYPLFCKSEAFLPLLIWHGMVYYWSRRRVQSLPAPPLLPVVDKSHVKRSKPPAENGIMSAPEMPTTMTPPPMTTMTMTNTMTPQERFRATQGKKRIPINGLDRARKEASAILDALLPPRAPEDEKKK